MAGFNSLHHQSPIGRILWKERIDIPTGIGQIIANNPQLQEFAERCLSQVFDLCRYGDLMADDICEDMGITEDEMYWMFEQLGYSREEE